MSHGRNWLELRFPVLELKIIIHICSKKNFCLFCIHLAPKLVFNCWSFICLCFTCFYCFSHSFFEGCFWISKVMEFYTSEHPVQIVMMTYCVDLLLGMFNLHLKKMEKMQQLSMWHEEEVLSISLLCISWRKLAHHELISPLISCTISKSNCLCFMWVVWKR